MLILPRRRPVSRCRRVLTLGCVSAIAAPTGPIVVEMSRSSKRPRGTPEVGHSAFSQDGGDAMLPTVENSHLSRVKWHLIQETMSASILARPEPSIYYIAVELRIL